LVVVLIYRKSCLLHAAGDRKQRNPWWQASGDTQFDIQNIGQFFRTPDTVQDTDESRRSI